ncbi:hypothetical protein HPB47_027086 [Ixodes persulcatus]|uniref:Uncharacterized protein n=1 Tax=Ixodes persulcatus TaxID=34615 RepID=A0AC60PWW2_IXOPE|nr:hypothetical protein HPB47_027086 [Ixodes persulcatus]
MQGTAGAPLPARATPLNAAGPHQGSVLMVYGLNSEKMNAEKLFNLLCLYGNVVRIKFLKSKDGCAMVQMGDPLAVERAVGHLNNAQFFDTKMQLGWASHIDLSRTHSHEYKGCAVKSQKGRPPELKR